MFQETIPKPENCTKLKSITSHLQQILECPVCFHELKYPFKWCTNGHGICTKCAEELETCPTCQALFTAENTNLPLCFKNLLAVLPRFCCYSDAGCEEIVDQNDEHEKFCGFRPFHCKGWKCDVTLPLCKLKSHIKENHENFKYTTLTNDKNETSGVIHIKCMNGLSKSNYSFTSSYFEGSWFWTLFKKKEHDDGLEITCYTTFVGRPVDNYFLTVKFKRGRFVYSKTLRAYEISFSLMNNFKDCDSEITNNSNDDGCCKLLVPMNYLKYLIDKDLGLSYSYKFFTMPKDKSPQNKPHT